MQDFPPLNGTIGNRRLTYWCARRITLDPDWRRRTRITKVPLAGKGVDRNHIDDGEVGRKRGVGRSRRAGPLPVLCVWKSQFLRPKCQQRSHLEGLLPFCRSQRPFEAPEATLADEGVDVDARRCRLHDDWRSNRGFPGSAAETGNQGDDRQAADRTHLPPRP